MSKKERSSRENTYPQRRRTPSFSASLLDAIYRSIDESNGDQEEVYREEILFPKQGKPVSTMRREAFVEEEKEARSLRRAVMIETWMEKQSTSSRTRSRHYISASSSSDSSYGGCIFSSSEAESSVKEKSRPKPVSPKQQEQKPQREGGGFTKTKLRALKIYGELKKVKQPISPGGRIASFLNSIFSSGSAKKVKMCSIGAMEDVRFERKSKSATCSVSSFSRSCLTKTPSSRGKSSNNGTKRSVRFYPVSVIVDEDSRPCGHKCIYDEDPGLMPMPQRIARSTSLKKVEVAKGAEYVRRYQKKNGSEFDFRGFHRYVEDEEDEESDDDYDDGESCASSDLFELDHLIGIGRYREELPVYETTNLKTNQAIANGFIL